MIVCPECGSTTVVLSSRRVTVSEELLDRLGVDHTVWRLRGCRDCSYTTQTIEVEVSGVRVRNKKVLERVVP